MNIKDPRPTITNVNEASMKKHVAHHLKREVDKVAEIYSRKRKYNPDGVTYIPKTIEIVSETMAAVTYERDDGKLMFCIFYYFEWGDTRQGKWRHLIPTDSHLLGMRVLVTTDTMKHIEGHNFQINIREEKDEDDIEKTEAVPEMQEPEDN